MAKSKPQPPTTDAAPAEGYTVLARRYRPQQFSDLVGQEPVARALVNALNSNRVAHAYLFTGARGVGKTSTARILAKALNCEKGPTATPCDACDACQAIASGDDIDVIEIDGASNRGIDEIRSLRETISSRPARSRSKIYIIDEVHMLTAPAFNALLKTLEEPPPHVKFIFATTEVQKIPVTILSRCQRFDFAGIGTAGIVARLREIVAREGMQADDEALTLVARRAAGSMRDAQSLLDQLLAFGGERLTVAQVHQLLGTAHDDRVAALATAVLQRDAKQALQLLSQAADEGLQLGEFLDQLIAYWRDLMVVHSAGIEGQELSVPSPHRDALAKQAAAMSLDTILAGLDVLTSAKARLRGTNHGRVLLEMTLVRLGRLDDLVSLSQLAQWLDQSQGSGSKNQEARIGERTGQAPSSPNPEPRTLNPGLPETSKKKPAAAAEPAAPLALTEQSLPRLWQEVLAQVGHMLASQLQKAGVPAISGPNTLVLRFPPEYNSERRHCEDPARSSRIEEALRKLTGRDCQVRVESVSGDGKTQPVRAADAVDSSSRHRRPWAAVEKEPLIQRAMEVLGARFVPGQTDEGFGAAPVLSSERVETAEGEDS